MVFQVRKSNGEFHCDPRHSIRKDGRTIKWHCNQGEFKIVFDGDNPFTETVNDEFTSGGGWIREEAKDHNNGEVHYKYEIKSPNGQPGLDPGLIVEP